MEKRDKQQLWIKQFIKFGLVGILNTAVDFIVYVGLIWLSVYYAWAQVIAYIAGIVNSYLLNNAFTFRSDAQTAKERLAKQMRFLVWNAVMLALSTGMLVVVKKWIVSDVIVAKIIVTIVIVAINFYGSKKWVFITHPRTKTE